MNPLLLVSGLLMQALVTQVNCPKVLAPGSIVVAQSAGSLANYPVILLACYTLDPTIFSINNSTTPPTITIGNSPAAFVDGEVPGGSINGSNVTFTLANTPTSGSPHLFLNGLRLVLNTDYSISGLTITMGSAPQTADSLIVDYRHQ